MKYITVKKLRELNACLDSINAFITEFGENGKIHVEKLIEILYENKDSRNYNRWLFENFNLTGICYGYYSDGKIAYKSYYKNSKLHGEYVGYYENGKIAHKTNYKNGELHGERIVYYENGNIYYKENYKNGELNGERIVYYSNSKIAYKENYENGKLIYLRSKI